MFRRVRVLAAAVALSVLAAACTSTEDAQPDRSAPPEEFVPVVPDAAPSAPETVRGWVSLAGAVVGATVVITDGDGVQIGEPAVTDDFGYFESDAPYGPHYSVVATGGTDDHGDVAATLRTQMNTDDAEAAANLGHIDVNIATTFVAEYIDRHPGVDEETAEAAVAVSMGAHPDDDIGAIVGTQAKAFNAAAYADDTINDTHIAESVDAIAAAVAPDQASVAAEEPVAAAAPLFAERAFVLDDPVSDVAVDIVKGFLGDQGKKLLTSWLGLDGDSAEMDELRQMRAQLDQLQVALAAAAAEARQLAADAVYSAAVDATNDVRGGISTATRLYMVPVGDRAIALGQARADRAGLAADAPADQVAAADAAVTTAEASYKVALDNFRNNYNTLAGGAFVKLNLFLEAGTGDAKSIVEKYADTIRARQRFISSADNDAVYAVYDDFASWQAAAAYLEAEYQSVIDGNVAGAVDMYNEAEARQVTQLPTRLDTPGVVIDLQSSLMWQGAGSGVLHWSFDIMEYMRACCEITPPGTPGGPAPFGGWRLPTQAEFADLLRDRGNRSVNDYMVSVSSPTGFNAQWWAALSTPVWAADKSTTDVKSYDMNSGSISSNPYTVHAVLNPNGSFGRLPDLEGWYGGIAYDTSRWVASRLPGANADVVQVRPLDSGEKYL